MKISVESRGRKIRKPSYSRRGTHTSVVVSARFGRSLATRRYGPTSDRSSSSLSLFFGKCARDSARGYTHARFTGARSENSARGTTVSYRRRDLIPIAISRVESRKYRSSDIMRARTLC